MLKIQLPFEETEAAEAVVQQLRNQVAELEAENAALRQLQETVRRNARIFHAVLSKSHEGFLLVTPQLTFLKAIHSALGNNEEELMGRSLLEKIHPDDCDLVSGAFARVLANPAQSITIRCRVMDGGGEWRWMEVEMTDMLDDPDVQAVVWNSRDVQGKECGLGQCQTPTGRSAPE